MIIFAAVVAGLLAVPAPPDVELDDLSRFPPREVCRPAMESLKEYGQWCAGMASAEVSWHRQPWLDRMADAERRYDCWAALEYAHIPPTTLHDLQELRRLIGPDAYRRGEMPAVPHHLFREP